MALPESRLTRSLPVTPPLSDCWLGRPRLGGSGHSQMSLGAFQNALGPKRCRWAHLKAFSHREWRLSARVVRSGPAWDLSGRPRIRCEPSEFARPGAQRVPMGELRWRYHHCSGRSSLLLSRLTARKGVFVHTSRRGGLATFVAALGVTGVLLTACGGASPASSAAAGDGNTGAWTQTAELKGVDTVESDFFGSSVAISGATAIVGANGHPDGYGNGRAYVFGQAVHGWRQTSELRGSDTVKGDWFGESVAVSNTTAVVGAPGTAKYAGSAYVFTKAARDWRQAAELGRSQATHGGEFGEAVAISGPTAVVGAPGKATFAGRAYVFSKTAAGWTQTAELSGSDAAAHDASGLSVAISGTTLVVGADGHANGAGAAYVFPKTTTGWKQSAELTSTDTVALGGFGGSVAVSGTIIVIGASGYATDAGRAYVFEKTTSGWTQSAELKGSDIHRWWRVPQTWDGLW